MELFESVKPDCHTNRVKFEIFKQRVVGDATHYRNLIEDVVDLADTALLTGDHKLLEEARSLLKSLPGSYPDLHQAAQESAYKNLLESRQIIVEAEAVHEQNPSVDDINNVSVVLAQACVKHTIRLFPELDKAEEPSPQIEAS